MRYNSSETSRKSNRGRKIFILVVVLFLGICVSLETRMHICRLKSIEVQPVNLIPASALRNNITVLHKHFWPALFLGRKAYTRQIESVYPVKCNLICSGCGHMILKTEALKPIFKMCWNNKFWYVSADGRIWPTDLETNKNLNFQQFNPPIIYWGENRVSPYEIGKNEGNIMKTSLPLENILGWYEDMKSVGWIRKVAKIYAVTDDGMQKVKLVFKRRDGTEGGAVLMPDERDRWVVLALAVNKICNDLQTLSQDDFIDATYKDKILVKSAAQ